MTKLTVDKRNTSVAFKGKDISWRNSFELNRYVSNLSRRTAWLSFSCGKDSIATWLYMMETGFWDDIIPVFYYYVPGLSFEEEALEYYEKVLGRHIIRIPSPNTLSWMDWGVFQTPQSNLIVKEYRDYIYECSFDNTDLWIREQNEQAWAYMATGVRMADGLNRRGVILQNGGHRSNGKKFYPCFDFSDKEVAEIVRAHNVKLPYDYAVWGRTFDGMQYRFLKDLKQALPEDYNKVLELYPLADVVLHRYEAGNSNKLILG
jgi:3'-phosphoadenosine 5'-phosphosulfate sulfotransferase (PAPS reductase)/FAD synthetase